MKFSRFTYAVCMVLITWNTASAQPKPEAIDHWKTNNPASKAVVDHSAWDALLQKYIRAADDGLNLFDYGGVTEDDKEALEGYLDMLSDVVVTDLNREEQRAYWVNAYNAITVNLVIDEYPVSSIRKVNSLFGFGPWQDEVFVVEDQDISLDNIEHGILRPLWDDPRTHYSVNCASFGCPNLAKRAWTAENMEEMLDTGARAFINSKRGVQGVDGNGVKVSSIYHWFKVDFGGNDTGVISHLKQYANDDLKQQLEGVTAVSDHDYDWNLNDGK